MGQQTKPWRALHLTNVDRECGAPLGHERHTPSFVLEAERGPSREATNCNVRAQAAYTNGLHASASAAPPAARPRPRGEARAKPRPPVDGRHGRQQVHAGMWVRNGSSLVSQIKAYQDVRRRAEMLDKDVVVLQIGASLIDNDEFMILLLYKFNLLRWTQQEFENSPLTGPVEDTMDKIAKLVEEFLGLLLMIVAERHVPGVGQVNSEACVVKEIVQQLCLRPLSHVELNSKLCVEGRLEHIIDQEGSKVSDYKVPVGDGPRRGLYELKPEKYAECNVYYYHYSREEISEVQEKLVRMRRNAGNPAFVPPPVPPPFEEPFAPVVTLMRCDVMLLVLRIVLERAANPQTQSFTEEQLHRTLYLIGYALYEQERDAKAAADAEEGAADEWQPAGATFTERASACGLEQLLQELCTNARVAVHWQLLAWTVARFRSVAAASAAAASAHGAASASAAGAEEAEPAVAEEVEMVGGAVREESQRRHEKAEKSRERIMAQMRAMQLKFMKSHAALMEEVQVF
ncbi:E3 ubiquitin-protein ligase UBR1 [Gryllus bimaculatus]|nr:E3 ubiquitin-protein ligase UBR1 [Gryllus bimaculatus]